MGNMRAIRVVIESYRSLHVSRWDSASYRKKSACFPMLFLYIIASAA